jgi:hypothetical protein
MAHLAAQPQITYTGQPSGRPMAQRKTADDGKTQRQRFIEAARELGADRETDAVKRVVRAMANKPKKASRKRKG